MRDEPATPEAYAARLGTVAGEGWQWIAVAWLGFDNAMPLYIEMKPTRWEVRDMFGTLHAYGSTPLRALKTMAREKRQRGRQEDVREQRIAGCGAFGRAAFHLDRAGAVRRVMRWRWGYRDESEAGRWASMLVARWGRDRAMLLKVWREEMAGARVGVTAPRAAPPTGTADPPLRRGRPPGRGPRTRAPTSGTGRETGGTGSGRATWRLRVVPA